MQLTDIIITITPADGKTQVINAVSASAALAGQTSAIQQFSIDWQRPAGYAHQEPAGFSLELLGKSTLTRLLSWDAEIIVYAIIKGDPAPRRMIARGWITETARTPAPPIGYRVKVKCTNSLGRAAGTRIGSKPWTKHNALQRLAALNTASPIGPIAAVEAPPWDNGIRADLDVDSRSALDVLKNSVDPTVTLEESADGLIHSAVLTGSRVWWPNATSALTVTGITPHALRLSAHAVADSARIADRTSLLTHVTIEGKTPGEQQTKAGELPSYDTHAKSWFNAAYGRQSAEHRVTTDIIVYPEKPAPAPWAKWASGLVEAGANPGERLEAAEALSQLVDPLEAGQLIDISLRAQTYIELDDAPADVDPAQRVIAGQLTISSQRLSTASMSGAAGLQFKQAATIAESIASWQIPINARADMSAAQLQLQLTLEPTRLSGVSALSFDQLPPSQYLTFNRAGKTRINQLTYVNRVYSAPSRGIEIKSRRFLNVSQNARLADSRATIADYAYLPS